MSGFIAEFIYLCVVSSENVKRKWNLNWINLNITKIDFMHAHIITHPSHVIKLTVSRDNWQDSQKGTITYIKKNGSLKFFFWFEIFLDQWKRWKKRKIKKKIVSKKKKTSKQTHSYIHTNIEWNQSSKYEKKNWKIYWKKLQSMTIGHMVFLFFYCCCFVD